MIFFKLQFRPIYYQPANNYGSMHVIYILQDGCIHVPTGGGESTSLIHFYYVINAKRGEGVQIACANACVINGLPQAFRQVILCCILKGTCSYPDPMTGVAIGWNTLFGSPKLANQKSLQLDVLARS